MKRDLAKARAFAAKKGRSLARRPRAKLARHTRLAPVTKDKVKRATRFERAFLSVEFVAFIHSQPCAAPGCYRTDVQCAHVGKPRSRGGRWYEIAPLCAAHHQEQEKRTKQFDAKYRTDLESIAAGLALRWKAIAGLP